MKRKLPKKIHEALKHLDEGVEMLRGAVVKNAPDLRFTLDGRLIGDIGEFLATGAYGIKLQKTQQQGFDGIDSEGRQVEIKTTRLNSIAFRKIADRVICIKLHGDTHWEVIFDGEGKRIAEHFPKTAFKSGNNEVLPNLPASLKSQRQLSIQKLYSLSPLITSH
jgi:hypothetical protein